MRRQVRTPEAGGTEPRDPALKGRARLERSEERGPTLILVPVRQGWTSRRSSNTLLSFRLEAHVKSLLNPMLLAAVSSLGATLAVAQQPIMPAKEWTEQ